MVEIWHAANATKSHVMMWWWSTDWMLQTFIGTPGEFVKVDLPAPTLECIQNRVSEQGKCSDDPDQQRGTALGSCDYEPAVLLKAISSALKTQQEEMPEAKKSAAIDIIEDFRTSDLVVDFWLKKWYERNIDRFGYDPREVICTWIADNIDDLAAIVPKTYPRQVLTQENAHSSAAFRTARALAFITGIASLISFVLVVAWRQRRVIRYAQPDFLYLVLMGFLLLSGAAYLYTLEPQTPTCILRPWFGLLGSSLELLPLIVKVSAILKAIEEANSFRRIKLSRVQLFGAVVLFLVIIIIYLIIWTAVDPPQRQEELVLTDQTNPVGGLFVEVQVECSSNSDWWVVLGLVWQLILLFWATILAYQTRNIRTEFNESQFLGFMIYTHFMFVLLRFILVVISDSFTPEDTMVVTSFLLSLDTLVTLNIYFLPKFYKAVFDPEGARRNLSGGGETSRFTNTGSSHQNVLPSGWRHSKPGSTSLVGGSGQLCLEDDTNSPNSSEKQKEIPEQVASRKSQPAAICSEEVWTSGAELLDSAELG